jgi:hypothetical protein
VLRQSRRKLSLAEVLDLAPVRAPHAEWREEGGEVEIAVRRHPGGLARVLSWFFTLPARKTFRLDRHGAEVWRRCDGATRVRDIAASLADLSGWPRAQAEESVVRFLAILSQRRLVGFAEPDGRA